MGDGSGPPSLFLDPPMFHHCTIVKPTTKPIKINFQNLDINKMGTTASRTPLRIK